MTHLTRTILALTVAFILAAGTFIAVGGAHAAGNPPGTSCTGYRYGKGGSRVCIRWVYPTTTTTTSTP